MRPARTTTKKNPVSSSKPSNSTSSQGRRDPGTVVSKYSFTAAIRSQSQSAAKQLGCFTRGRCSGPGTPIWK